MGRFAGMLIAVAACCGTSGAIPPVGDAAGAGAAQAVRTWFERCVNDLNADELSRRDAAADELRDDPRSTLEMIERCLGESGHSSRLSAEQRERLWRIGYQRFLSTPRAAMGVSFARFDGAGGGVEIGGTVAGFDATRVMEAGDIIRSMNGAPVNVNDDARAAILSHDPGDEVSVELVRRGEARVVRLRLGRFDLLRNANSPDDSVMGRAWSLRCARSVGAMPNESPVVESGLTPERWAELGVGEPRVRLPAVPNRGGGAMLAAAEEMEGAAGLRAGGAAAGVPEFADADFSMRLGELAKRDPEIGQMLAQIANMRARVQRNDQRIKQGSLTALQRRLISQETDSLKLNIAAIRQKLKLQEERLRLKGQ